MLDWSMRLRGHVRSGGHDSVGGRDGRWDSHIGENSASLCVNEGLCSSEAVLKISVAKHVVGR